MYLKFNAKMISLSLFSHIVPFISKLTSNILVEPVFVVFKGYTHSNTLRYDMIHANS